VHALADRIAAAEPRPALLLNPTAAEPAADLADLLTRRGVAARSVAVYESAEVDLASPPAGLDGVLIHSSKAARAVARGLAGADAQAITAFAISTAAAAPLKGLGLRSIAVASSPNEATLLKLLEA
jgi:uroporphyrinogen-III synthase